MPFPLYSSDYGFQLGSFIYRARFAAEAIPEQKLILQAQGGNAYRHQRLTGLELSGQLQGQQR